MEMHTWHMRALQQPGTVPVLVVALGRAQQMLPVQSKGELQPLFLNCKLCSQVGVLQGEEGCGSPAGHVCSRAGPRRLLQALTQGQALPRSPCPMSHAPLAQGQGQPQPASTNCKRLQLTTSRTKRDPRSESGLETQNSAVLKRCTMVLFGVIVTSGGFASLISITSGCDGGSTMESWGETNQRVASPFLCNSLLWGSS